MPCDYPSVPPAAGGREARAAGEIVVGGHLGEPAVAVEQLGHRRAVHIVVFEELVQDFERELRALYGFAGVDPTVASRVQPNRHNAFAVPRNRVAAQVVGSARMRKLSRAIVPYKLRWPVEKRLLASRPKPSIDPETDRLLTDYYEPDVRELTELLGRPLPWPRWSDARRGCARSRIGSERVSHVSPHSKGGVAC